jgi:hypothetical protein
MKAIIIVAFFIGVIWYIASDDDNELLEEAYESGYYDSWASTCDEIDYFSSNISNTLEKENIC